MEKFLEINTLSLTLFGVSIFGILKYFFKKYQESEDKKLTDQKRQVKGMLALLHSSIFTNGCEYLRKGKVTVAELNDLEKLYEPYREMGGNSTAKTIVENVRKLPIKNENIECIKGDDN